jgi:hypothetical protein
MVAPVTTGRETVVRTGSPPTSHVSAIDSRNRATPEALNSVHLAGDNPSPLDFFLRCDRGVLRGEHVFRILSAVHSCLALSLRLVILSIFPCNSELSVVKSPRLSLW